MAGGRPRGAVSELTKVLRQDTLDAYDALGGKEWLVRQGKSNPALFMPLLHKFLPAMVETKQVIEKTILINFNGLAPIKHDEVKVIEGEVVSEVERAFG